MPAVPPGGVFCPLVEAQVSKTNTVFHPRGLLLRCFRERPEDFRHCLFLHSFTHILVWGTLGWSSSCSRGPCAELWESRNKPNRALSSRGSFSQDSNADTVLNLVGPVLGEGMPGLKAEQGAGLGGWGAYRGHSCSGEEEGAARAGTQGSDWAGQAGAVQGRLCLVVTTQCVSDNTRLFYEGDLGPTHPS